MTPLESSAPLLAHLCFVGKSDGREREKIQALFEYQYTMHQCNKAINQWITQLVVAKSDRFSSWMNALIVIRDQLSLLTVWLGRES